jgi:hypothetical protein
MRPLIASTCTISPYLASKNVIKFYEIGPLDPPPPPLPQVPEFAGAYPLHSKSINSMLQLRFGSNGLLYLSKFVASRLYYLVRSQNMPNIVCPRVKGTRQFFSLYHILCRSRSTATSTCVFCRKMYREYS